mmetsp:Transcript_25677/g.43724  ORF Transcript_25677/g.43724 Transcript_25677/m.43724 type:complete len:277 (+) Transcript_25677:1043-1873(+)
MQIGGSILEPKDVSRQSTHTNTKMSRATEGRCSKALRVHNAGPMFCIVRPTNPHLMEHGQDAEHTAAQPRGVHPFRVCDNFRGHGRFMRIFRFVQVVDAVLDAVAQPIEERIAAGEHDIAVLLLPDLRIALPNALKAHLVQTDGRLVRVVHRRVKEQLRALEPLLVQHDILSVGQRILHDIGLTGLGLVHGGLVLIGRIANALLHVVHDVHLICGGEIVPSGHQERVEVIGDCTSRDLGLVNVSCQGVAFEYGHRHRHILSGVHHKPRRLPTGIEA